MGDYLLGLATLPALLLVAVLLWAAVEPVSGTWSECPACGRVVRPGRFEPWWFWELHRRRSWARHMRTSAKCREHTNKWLRRNGSSRIWTESGFRKVPESSNG